MHVTLPMGGSSLSEGRVFSPRTFPFTPNTPVRPANIQVFTIALPARSSRPSRREGEVTCADINARRKSGAVLLFLFVMNGVLAQSRAVLFQLQLLAARFTAERVVVVASLFADEEDHFFLFILGHRGRLDRIVVGGLRITFEPGLLQAMG